MLASCLLAAGALFLTAQSAQAQESPALDSPIGLYLGAGFGPANVRQSGFEAYPNYAGLYRHDVGWNVFAGVRPLSFLGAEIGYTDFGAVHRNSYVDEPVSATISDVLGRGSANAAMAFAVGYLPLPLPWLDLYGKAGVARLHETFSFVPQNVSCPPGGCGVPPAQPGAGTANDWDFAYGIGTQLRFGALGFRLEYQRINDPNGDPDMLSVGVVWTLL